MGYELALAELPRIIEKILEEIPFVACTLGARPSWRQYSAYGRGDLGHVLAAHVTVTTWL